MKFRFLILSVLVFFELNAQGIAEKEKESIRETIALLAEGWKQGNGEKFASAFTEDAEFMVWFGMSIEGKKAIAEGHDFIFDRFYANTIWKLQPLKINFLDANIALAHCSGAIYGVGETVPHQPDAVPLLVLKKMDKQWKIVALQNTPHLVEEMWGDGNLSKFKKWLRENKRQ